MTSRQSDIFLVAAGHQALIREIGLDAEAIFSDPRIHVWRRLSDRENCTLDHTSADGQSIRLHIKRYPAQAPPTPADLEVAGYKALDTAEIPAASVVAHGRLSDGRSYIVLLDLAGYAPGDKLVAAGTPFEILLIPAADLAARLHAHGLHHRDLYLCHFMAKIEGETADIKLIDTARVRPLPRFLMRRRWIIKDLAQFWFSTTQLPIDDEQRTRWLNRYAEKTGISASSLRSAILRKVRAIARHHLKLNRKQPSRNVSIPA